MPEGLYTFLDVYSDFFRMIYGLLYFTVGLSVSLHSRQYSRLTLAKSLLWFGGFGICIAIYNWGFIFLPLVDNFSDPRAATFWHLVHYILQAFSYLLLFQFGIEMLRPNQEKWCWLRLLPTYFFAFWLVGPYIIGFSLISGIETWGNFINACSRYFLCLPAAALSVAGLIRQQRLQIKPLKLPKIDNVVRAAAGALAAYSLFEGFIVPKTFFFPATVINMESFQEALFLPSYFYLSIIGLTLYVTMNTTLDIFDIETDNLVKAMEEAQVIATERERIARDLHDGALQQVYAAGLLAQSLKKHMPEKNINEVQQLVLTINQAILQLRGFLPWKQSETEEVDLVGALMPKIENARRYIKVDTDIDPRDLPALSVEQTRHLTSLLGEALSNAIRHSRTDRIRVALKREEEEMILEVQDFGTGISLHAEQGYGLKNMRDRARLLGANFEIFSGRQEGTTVKVVLPITEGHHAH